MILLAALDDKNGMLFNKRRQSQDQALRTRISKISAARRLWVSPYTAKQFADDAPEQLCIADDPAARAEAGDFCFIEDTDFSAYAKNVEKIIIYRWNRTYPGDKFFDMPLADKGWRLVSTTDIAGNSHESITEEVYEK